MESKNSLIANRSSSFRLQSPSLNLLRLRRIFDVFDKNGDDMITVYEIHQALNVLGLDVDLSELELTIQPYIQPGNLGLTFDNFLALHQSLDETYFGQLPEGNGGDQDLQVISVADQGIDRSKTNMARHEEQEEADLSEAFKVFDEDGDGYISAKELQVVLTKLGFSEGNEIDSCQKMISSQDSNHDGGVDFSEFKHMMQRVVVRS